MKILKKCPILVGIVVITIALSIVSLIFKDTVYAGYADKYESGDIPLLALAFKGAIDEVYPWSDIQQEALLPQDVQTDEAPESPSQQEEVTTEQQAQDIQSEPEEAVYISGNDVSGDSLSGNSVSGNSEDITYEFTEVDDDYFTDAVFIGDSRTVGLSEYCEPLDTRATFYAKISLTIFDVFKKEYIKTDEGKISLEEALTRNQFGKVYIMLGLNEIGTGDSEYFKAAYAEVIGKIRELQPDAIIYIQGIMHVTAHKSDADKNFNNEKINARNAAIAELADNKTIFYIDMNEAVDDENGNLEAGLSFDDVHLKASSYERWHEFLLHNAIVR
ncbi:GDSL-type esterase/lipase family protein [Butyrivibrio sp. XPD2006]|uniref:GDSL-type esterase/lipase family protein n=1 Tax=Butyrivibrio sp. XPD2006 TaxID=1280668 RepID=UPI000424A2A2|nr:GDSL-type esterase/lipase family protein [Butyrivibrio sp. XPD2006]